MEPTAVTGIGNTRSSMAGSGSGHCELTVHTLRSAVREYRRELSSAVEEAIDSIRLAIERAIEDRRRGERRAHERIEQLAEVERRCQQLAAVLRPDVR